MDPQPEILLSVGATRENKKKGKKEKEKKRKIKTKRNNEKGEKKIVRGRRFLVVE